MKRNDLYTCNTLLLVRKMANAMNVSGICRGIYQGEALGMKEQLKRR